MTPAEVLAFIAVATRAGVEVWVDGGWGVDALVGRQTRAHSDLDLVVSNDSLPRLRSLLEDHGFVVTRDWLPTAIAFRNPDGREVDLHPLERTSDGGGDQIQLDGVSRWHYEPPVIGMIDGAQVRCCSLSTQVRAHLGYAPGDKDHADMRMLHEELDVRLPPPYSGA